MSVPKHALILTAGLGTRLHPLTMVRAKPAMPVAGEPLVRRIVRWLVAQGVTELTLNLHHRPETIATCLGDGADLGARVRYSWEHPVILGSAGGPRQALDIIGAELFFVVNGDVLTDVPLAPLVEARQRTGALATLALVPNHEFLKYGGLRLAPDGTLDGYAARGRSAEGSLHFIGPQLVHRDAFATVKRGEVAQTLRGVYDELNSKSRGSVRGVVSDAHYWDIGTVGDYWRTSWALGAPSPAGAEIARSATITESILWDRVVIGERAVVDRCIVTDDVTVPAGAVYRRSILLRGAHGDVVSHPLELE